LNAELPTLSFKGRDLYRNQTPKGAASPDTMLALIRI
jgi:hypothetical protein